MDQVAITRARSEGESIKPASEEVWWRQFMCRCTDSKTDQGEEGEAPHRYLSDGGATHGDSTRGTVFNSTKLSLTVIDADEEVYGRESSPVGGRLEALPPALSPRPEAEDSTLVLETDIGLDSTSTGAYSPASLHQAGVFVSMKQQEPYFLKPSIIEVDRGVHVEKKYDYYDPATGKIKVIRMDDRVLHRRLAKTRTQLVLQDLQMVHCRKPTPHSRPKAGDPAMYGSGVSIDVNDDSDTESWSSAGSVDDTADNPSPGASMGLFGRHGSTERKEKLKRMKSLTDTEIITAWGVIAGKVMHFKLLDFPLVTGRVVADRRMRLAAEGKYGKVLESVRARARLVVAQAGNLARRISRDKIDKLDFEWQEDELMTLLFSADHYDTLMLLANATCKLLTTQPTLVDVQVPCRVFGDIHGQLRDLLLLFRAFGTPAEGKHDREQDGCHFVFNGDFVDRGEHQLEVMGLLLALKVYMPLRVWLIRGNHEDRMMNERYGFRGECNRLMGKKMGPKVYEAMHKVFDHLPFAALVANRVLVVHGGIGNGAWRLNDLRAVKRPLNSSDLQQERNRWLYNILWSDPIEDDQVNREEVFGVHESPRGCQTTEFGWNVTKTFCARNGLSLIVRSHQSKQDSLGFDVMHEQFLMRIFSARDYEGHGNDGAVLLISPAKGQGHHGEKDILTVRPQVLASVTKARMKNRWDGSGTESQGLSDKTGRNMEEFQRRLRQISPGVQRQISPGLQRQQRRAGVKQDRGRASSLSPETSGRLDALQQKLHSSLSFRKEKSMKSKKDREAMSASSSARSATGSQAASSEGSSAVSWHMTGSMPARTFASQFGSNKSNPSPKGDDVLERIMSDPLAFKH